LSGTAAHPSPHLSDFEAYTKIPARRMWASSLQIRRLPQCRVPYTKQLISVWAPYSIGQLGAEAGPKLGPGQRRGDELTKAQPKPGP
jgi:hypothetical protein